MQFWKFDLLLSCHEMWYGSVRIRGLGILPVHMVAQCVREPGCCIAVDDVNCKYPGSPGARLLTDAGICFLHGSRIEPASLRQCHARPRPVRC
jgi:hypothetical protein